jgi:sulfonate transport system substrate-binding protein
MRWVKRLIAVAVLSMSTALAGVGATDVREQLSPSVRVPVPVLEAALKRQAYGIKPIDAGLIAEQQKLADTFFALGFISKSITVSELARKSGT